MMLARALVAACACACALALTPLPAGADDNDCALYLAGPGRTSAYDYNLNLLRGNFGYDGQHTCITYDAVNQAYLEARKRIVVARPKGDWKPEDYASVGELILDISINLARTYGLTYEEIEKGLPLVDTSRTLIREVCPPVFSHVECRAGKYRRLDGLCNNLEHPTWGSTNSPFQRLIGPLFADGINAPRISHTGRDLPLSRVVSRTMHPDDGFHDHAGTIMVIAWGQFMDHDYTLTGTPLDPLNRNDPEECCKRPPHLKHPYCNEIRIPDDDYFYRLWGVKCIDFVRAFPSPRPGCRLGSRAPYNTLTGVLDGNTVYGVTDKFARKLRTGYGGLLRMNPVFKDYGLKDLLPLKLDIPDEGCTRPNKNMYCFEAGEIRVNEQLILTVMHTLMAREHNRVANGLASVNPHWDDETLYQEARRINIAEIQHITFNEFLPILLGKDVMEKFGLVLEKDGYWEGYDPTVNPDVIASFAAAAYRFGHSLLPTAVERWSKAHKFIASKRLSDLIRRPYDLYRAGVLDEYVMGLMNQVAQAMDDSITQEVTNHLFKKVGARFGMDLVSFNMQRGREFGVPGYMEFRKFCGLNGANTFQELFGSMPNETVRKYETIFEHPIDVDLWSGGVSERPLPGSMLGPTFACIIATQFSYSRRGDRFWYELPNQPSSFTPEQLTELRKARLARVICDNTDIIDTTQLYPMVLPDHELNPRVPCRSGIIPSIDFSKWAEPPPSFPSAAKQFITDAIATNINLTEPCNDDSSLPQNSTTNTAVEISATKTTVTDCNDTIEFNDEISTNNTQFNEIESNDNCSDIDVAAKPKFNSDTVLKYVYKTNEKEIVPNKSKAYTKNSVDRQKRSINMYSNLESNIAKEIVPLTVNYETLHLPEVADDARNLQSSSYQQHPAPIKESNLANFNIETLHEPSISERASNEEQRQKNDSEENDRHNLESCSENPLTKFTKENYDDDNHLRKPVSNDSEEDEGSNEDSHKATNPHDDGSYEGDRHNNDEYSRHADNNSKEHYSRKDDSHSLNSQENDSNENSSHSNESQNSKDIGSKEELRYNDKSRPYNSHEDDSEEAYHKEKSSKKILNDNSKEDDHINYKSKLQDTQLLDSKEDLRNNDESLSRKPLGVDSEEDYNSNDSRTKNDDIKEGYRQIDDSKQQNLQLNDSKEDYLATEVPTTVPTIQDIDLGDFSYERIQIRQDGKVEAVQDLPNDSTESNENNSNENIANKNLESLQQTNKSSDYSVESTSDPLAHSINFSVEDNKPININDGEIKPVVEITDEDSNEEINSNISNESSDSILGSLKVDNIINEKKPVNQPHIGHKTEKDNVKQQFERIPLDYKHDHGIEKDPIKNYSVNLDNLNNNDGTVDTLSPKEVIYDENLDFKFGDVSIVLPDIKLPEDVLSYNYEDTRDNKEIKKKPKGYGNSYESNDENVGDDDNNRSNEYYNDHFDNYKEEEKEEREENNDDDNEEDNEDENEDLYEKFVRERFGKRGSFKNRPERRSENLKQAPINAELYDTIKAILNKTKKTSQEAANSGDPKAGYMWTLEYGEQL